MTQPFEDIRERLKTMPGREVDGWGYREYCESLLSAVDALMDVAKIGRWLEGREDDYGLMKKVIDGLPPEIREGLE